LKVGSALPENISLSYLPIANRVKLRLTATEKIEISEPTIDEEITKLNHLFKIILFLKMEIL
jgi:hypothetical protein